MNGRLGELFRDDKKDSKDDLIDDARAPGRNSNIHLGALLVQDNAGEVWFIPYGCFLPEKAGKVKEGARRLYFAKDDEQRYEIEIQGPQAQYLVDMIAAGKRASIRPGPPEVTSITVEPVE